MVVVTTDSKIELVEINPQQTDELAILVELIVEGSLIGSKC